MAAFSIQTCNSYHLPSCQNLPVDLEVLLDPLHLSAHQFPAIEIESNQPLHTSHKLRHVPVFLLVQHYPSYPVHLAFPADKTMIHTVGVSYCYLLVVQEVLSVHQYRLYQEHQADRQYPIKTHYTVMQHTN